MNSTLETSQNRLIQDPGCIKFRNLYYSRGWWYITDDRRLKMVRKKKKVATKAECRIRNNILY